MSLAFFHDNLTEEMYMTVRPDYACENTFFQDDLIEEVYMTICADYACEKGQTLSLI